MSQVVFTVITTCTKKKTATPHAYIPSGMVFETQDELSDYWNKLLKSCPESRKLQATDLYKGRGFMRIMQVMKEDLSRIWVISAGLGFLPASSLLVPYNLTTSIGTDQHVKKHLQHGRFMVDKWWAGLNNGKNAIAEFIENRPGIIVLAVSRSYLEMIHKDLVSLAPEHLARVRIVGNELEEVASADLFDCIMPYDARLNSDASPAPGSKIDFAQRAAQHFITQVLQSHPKASAKEHAKLVHESMNSYGDFAEAIRNSSMDDLELRNLVLAEWDSAYGKPSRMLQIIRKVHKRSVSEKRLDRIFKELMQERTSGEIDSEEEEEG